MEVEVLYWIALTAAAVAFFYGRRGRRRHTLPPSPRALPVVGHLHLLKEPFHRFLESLAHRHGPVFHLRLGFRRFLVVSSPDAAEQCFVQNDVVFANRPRYMAGDVLGNGYRSIIWAPHGDLWRNLRRTMTVGAFSPSRIQQSSQIRQDEVRFMARDMGSGGGQLVDLSKAFSLLMKNVMMRILCGRRWWSHPGAHELFAPAKLMTVCDFFPVLRWVGYKGLEKEMRELDRRRQECLAGLLAEARDKKKEEGSVKTTSTLVDKLLAAQEAEPEYYTDDILRGIIQIQPLVLDEKIEECRQLLAEISGSTINHVLREANSTADLLGDDSFNGPNTLTAGSDTTARTMEWAMSLLLNHPDAFQKARSEINAHVNPERLVSDSDLPNLTYLRCIIDETLRLFPVAPLLLPHCSSADSTVAGYHVDKDTTVLVNVWAMHRDPNVWEDPMMFKPERFEADGGNNKAFNFMPFGMGRRACPASNLGMRIVMLALATCIQCFDWEGEGIEMEEIPGITMAKSKPLHAMCRPRPCMVDHLLSET